MMTGTVSVQEPLWSGRGATPSRAYRCMRCGRPLSADASTQRGLGPICCQKVRFGGGGAEDESGLLIPQPLAAGIVVRADTDGNVLTNVPRTVVHHSPTGYAFGYGGSGPADLALNILEAVLRAQGYQGPRTPCYKGDCFKLAYRLHQDFKWAFIASMPKEGDVLPYQQVVAWIEEHNTEHELE